MPWQIHRNKNCRQNSMPKSLTSSPMIIKNLRLPREVRSLWWKENEYRHSSFVRQSGAIGEIAARHNLRHHQRLAQDDLYPLRRRNEACKRYQGRQTYGKHAYILDIILRLQKQCSIEDKSHWSIVDHTLCCSMIVKTSLILPVVLGTSSLYRHEIPPSYPPTARMPIY